MTLRRFLGIEATGKPGLGSPYCPATAGHMVVGALLRLAIMVLGIPAAAAVAICLALVLAWLLGGAPEVLR